MYKLSEKKVELYMAKENVTIRMEPELRAQAVALFKSLGMDLIELLKVKKRFYW